MTDFIRLPPDSTGKRVQARRFAHITYGGGTLVFSPRQRITGSNSGADAFIEKVTGSTVSGVIQVVYFEESPSFEVGETISTNSTPHATVTAVIDSFIQKGVIADADFSDQLLHVDAYGSAFTRFVDGSPRLDAFGRLAVAEQTNVFSLTQHYESPVGDGVEQFWQQTVGTANLDFEPTFASSVLSIGTGATDAIKLTTNQHFTYFPGIASTMLLTLSVGDTGKPNVTREWGMFNDDDGFFFRLSGTTLQVVLRSSSSGVVTEQVIDQENWNEDHVDGAFGVVNLSRFQLDVSKLNIYWLDYQWLGAGKVRLGVVSPTGERITVHSFRNANTSPRPYTRTGNLPLRVAQYNTGVSGSTSEMSLTCANVAVSTSAQNLANQFSAVRASDIFSKTGLTSSTLFAGIRAAATVNTHTNRKLLVPHEMSAYVTAPCTFYFYEGMEIDDGTWVQMAPSHAIEANLTGTTATTGRLVGSRVVGAGTHTVSLSDIFSYSNTGICTRADGQPGRPIIIYVAPLAGTTSVDVHFGLRWLEFG